MALRGRKQTLPQPAEAQLLLTLELELALALMLVLRGLRKGPRVLGAKLQSLCRHRRPRHCVEQQLCSRRSATQPYCGSRSWRMGRELLAAAVLPLRLQQLQQQQRQVLVAVLEPVWHPLLVVT